MARQQRSKKARQHRKEAVFAGLPGWEGHPSHLSGKMQIHNRRRHIYFCQRMFKKILGVKK